MNVINSHLQSDQKKYIYVYVKDKKKKEDTFTVI